MKHDYKPLISSTYILHAIEFLNGEGVITSDYLRQHEIELDKLYSECHFLPFQQSRALFRSISQGETLPHLGLLVGNSFNITSHGIAGIAAISQRTLYECMEVCQKLLAYRFPALNVSLVERDLVFGLKFEELIPLGEDLPLIMEMVFSAICGIDKILFSEDDRDYQIHFSYPEPEYSESYVKHFSRKPLFNMEHSEFLFPIARKEELIRYYDPVNSKVLLEEFIREVPRVNKDNIFKQVTSILESSEGFLADQPKVAQMMAVSPRTLRRKFKESGSSFQQMLNLVKQRFATHYLLHSELSITEISLILDFNDSSHFSKAFKSWKGMSPSIYRSIERPCLSKGHFNQLGVG